MKKLAVLLIVLLVPMALAIEPGIIQQPPVENMALQTQLQTQAQNQTLSGTGPAGAAEQVRHDSVAPVGVREPRQYNLMQEQMGQAGGGVAPVPMIIRPGTNVLAGAVRAEELSALPGGGIAAQGEGAMAAVRHDSVAAGGPVTVRPGDQILVNVRGTEVAVIPGEETVVIRDGNVVVDTTELTIENGRPMFGERELRVPPSQIQRNIGGRQIREMSLEQGEDGMGVYRVRHDSSFRLFGFIEMQAEVTGDYNIETGTRVSQQNPWWSFLATEVQAGA